jgi:hypothetical protein
VRQTLFLRVVFEFITVKARQALDGAKPQKTVRIGDDLIDIIARQTFCRRIGFK